MHIKHLTTPLVSQSFTLAGFRSAQNGNNISSTFQRNLLGSDGWHLISFLIKSHKKISSSIFRAIRLRSPVRYRWPWTSNVITDWLCRSCQSLTRMPKPNCFHKRVCVTILLGPLIELEERSRKDLFALHNDRACERVTGMTMQRHFNNLGQACGQCWAICMSKSEAKNLSGIPS